MCTSPDCSCSTQLLLNVTSVLSFFLLFICSFSSLTLSLLPLFFTPFTFFLSVSFFLSYSFFILFFGCLHLSLPYPLLFHLSFFPPLIHSFIFFFFCLLLYFFLFLIPFIFSSFCLPFSFSLPYPLFYFLSLPSPLSSPLSLHPPPPLSCLYTPLGPQFGLSSSSFLLSLSLFLSLFIYSFFFYYLSLIPYTLPLSSLFPICTP